VREERTRVAVVQLAMGEPRLAEVVRALLAASPVTDLLSPLRLEPALDLQPLAAWLRDPSLGRAVADRYLELGFERVGAPYAVALLGRYNAKGQAVAARTATAYLCHLQLLRLISRPRGAARREDLLGELKAICGGRDKSLVDLFGLFAAAGRVGLQRPPDVREGGLVELIDQYAAACGLLVGEARLKELVGLVARGVEQLALTGEVNATG
jgi:hypothetical protein